MRIFSCQPMRLFFLGRPARRGACVGNAIGELNRPLVAGSSTGVHSAYWDFQRLTLSRGCSKSWMSMPAEMQKPTAWSHGNSFTWREGEGEGEGG